MNQQPFNPSGLPSSVIAIFGIVYLALFFFGLVVAWRICSKAGYSGALSLLMLLPLVNLVMIIMFAFSRWPVQRELDAYKQRAPDAAGGYLVS